LGLIEPEEPVVAEHTGVVANRGLNVAGTTSNTVRVVVFFKPLLTDTSGMVSIGSAVLEVTEELENFSANTPLALLARQTLHNGVFVREVKTSVARTGVVR
jgi:hypothetical protein